MNMGPQFFYRIAKKANILAQPEAKSRPYRLRQTRRFAPLINLVCQFPLCGKNRKIQLSLKPFSRTEPEFELN